MDTSIISQKQMDLSALDAIFGTDTAVAETPSPINKSYTVDTVLDAVEKPGAAEEPVVPVPGNVNVAEILDSASMDIASSAEVTEDAVLEATENKGRPKVEKNALVTYLKSKIETSEFGIPSDYDDKVSVDEYLTKLPEKDLYNLLDSNWKQREDDIRNVAPTDFYEALPPEAKAVAEYAFNGGNDWKAFYQALGKTEEVRAYDINNEDHHAPIVYSYLAETTQMTEPQIAEQIQDWKDTGKLDKKAAEFKGPLDAIKQKQVDILNQQAQQNKKQQEEIANFYAENVYTTLQKGELANVKLDKKVLAELNDGLLTTAPGPFSGKPVNLLGHILEKIQFIEPDYETLALMTWIGMDKENALKAIRQQGTNEATIEAVKLIKLNQGIATAGQGVPVADKSKIRKLPDTSKVLKRK